MCNPTQEVQSGLTQQEILDAITHVDDPRAPAVLEWRPPAGSSQAYRYRWASLASLENGDADRALVFATLAQAAATEMLNAALRELR